MLDFAETQPVITSHEFHQLVGTVPVDEPLNLFDACLTRFICLSEKHQLQGISGFLDPSAFGNKLLYKVSDTPSEYLWS